MELNQPDLPNREEIEDFISSMDNYTTVIPDEVTEYYLKRSGFVCPDPRVKRMVSLAAQKFLSDIVNDTLQIAKLKAQNPNFRRRDRKLVLTTEDLAAALREYGVTVKKPDYFADTMSAGLTAPVVNPKKK